MTGEIADDWMEQAQDLFMPTYPLQPALLDHGRGCYLYDTDGRAYLDFAAGIAVCSLGHAHRGMIEAAREQFEKMIMCPGSYVSVPRLDCARILVDRSCMDQVFFCNSGAEAIEGAIKLARKWAYETKGEGAHEIITFGGSFHGRTMGAASLTQKRHSQPFFGPYLEGIHFAAFNDIESVEALASDKTAAIIVEPVQGEGGIYPAGTAFLQDLRALCDRHDIALVFDEIQSGMGRLGTFFAYERFGTEPDIVAPDIITLAKGLGGGFPVGALMARSRFSAHLTPGTHGTTYGGNPLATRVALAVISEIIKPGFLDNVTTTGNRLMEGLDRLGRETGQIGEVRGMGLMIGADLIPDVKKILPLLREAGLMATAAGENTLRLTPPLIAGRAECDEALDKIGEVLKAV